jgi:hypothetical protein
MGTLARRVCPPAVDRVPSASGRPILPVGSPATDRASIGYPAVDRIPDAIFKASTLASSHNRSYVASRNLRRFNRLYVRWLSF